MRSAAAGAQLGDQKMKKLESRMDQFSSSRESVRELPVDDCSKPHFLDKSPTSDAVEQTLNRSAAATPLPEGPSWSRTARGLAQASTSAVASFLPRSHSTPSKAMSLNMDSDDEGPPGLTSDSDSEGDDRPAKPTASSSRLQSHQRRVFGIHDSPDPATARGPIVCAPLSAGSMSLDPDDVDDVSALSFGSSWSGRSHRSDRMSSIYANDARAGVDPPAAGGGRGELSVAQLQLIASERQAVAHERTAKATEKGAETEGESLRMSHQIHELALAKQNGSERVHDSHDSKCMRMLVNNCAVDADDQPIAALSDKPTPGSMVVVDKWIATVTKRTLEPVDRAEKYGLNLTPTKEIIKLTSQCRFGTDGLHPDLFITFSFESARDLEKTGGENFNKKGLEPGDLTLSVKDYQERCESMCDWVRVTLSPETGARMLRWMRWGCKKTRTDQSGDWSLSDLKLLHLKVLDEFQLERETTLDSIKSVCRGNADEGDESYYPKLAKVREIAMRPMPGGRGTLHPPAWISFLTEDVLNRDGSVRYASCGLEVRDKQLKTSAYDQNRKLRNDREKERAKELARLLCNKPKKGDKDSSRGSGAVEDGANPDDVGSAVPPAAAPAPSDTELAAVYAA